MIFNTMTKTDAYYLFEGDNGLKLIMPLDSVILVDDESGMKAIKLIASRRTIGLLRE